MKKRFLLAFLPFLSLVSCGTGSSFSSSSFGGCGTSTLFPGKEQFGNYVGDVMPYYEDGVFYVYYLNDLRSGPYGFHPIFMTKTTDFSNWSEPVEAIPASKDPGNQDVGLGTGSLIKDPNGLYHFYYVGYNSFGNVEYFEKIQHATSTNLVDWTKHPEDGFFGGTNDFRDPFVFYNEGESEYWMILTTSKNGQSVLEKYVSDDLSSWNDGGVFYDDPENNYNMECPSLAKIGSLWYLSFSAQKELGPERTVNYRYSSDLVNWSNPSDERLDGAGFYAGRFIGDGSSTYTLGWCATKQYGYDDDPFDWGGNLVCHQIGRKNNGDLYICPIDSVVDKLDSQFQPKIISDNNVSQSNGIYGFDDSSSSSLVFDKWPSTSFCMEFNLSFSSLNGKFGFSFDTDGETFGSTNIVLSLKDSSLSYYVGSTSDGSFSIEPQIELPLAYSAGKEYGITVVGNDECLSVYVGGKTGLTTRIMNAASNSFSLFSHGSGASLSSLLFCC